MAYYTGGYVTSLYGPIAGGAAGGFAGGLVSGRGDLKAALQGAITGAAFGVVGHGLGLEEGGIGQLIGHAAVGCGSSMMGGGSCLSGALSAGVTKAFAGTINGIDSANTGVSLQRALAAAVVGGTASVLGGGKFENGAITGAFSRLFNDEMYSKPDPNGEPYVPYDKFPAESKFILSNRQINPDGDIIFSTPTENYKRIGAPSGGGGFVSSYRLYRGTSKYYTNSTIWYGIKH